MIPTFTFIFTIIAPAAFWFWFFIRLDRADPEPKKLLFKLFLLGMLGVLIAGVLEHGIFQILFPGTQTTPALGIPDAGSLTLSGLAVLFLAGVIEEPIKFYLLKEAVYNKIEFNQIADGIFYAVSLALGFATLENIEYFITLLNETETQTFVAGMAIRAIITTLLHLTAAGVAGLALGRKKYTPQHSKNLLYFGLLIAILIHGAFNLFTQIPYGIIPLLLITGATLAYLISAVKKFENKLVWKLITPP